MLKPFCAKFCFCVWRLDPGKLWPPVERATAFKPSRLTGLAFHRHLHGLGNLVEGGLVTPVSLMLNVVPPAHSVAPLEHHSLKVWVTWVAAESPSPVTVTGVSIVPLFTSINALVYPTENEIWSLGKTIWINESKGIGLNIVNVTVNSATAFINSSLLVTVTLYRLFGVSAVTFILSSLSYR